MAGLDILGYSGKTVVVTGGASGMGEAAARLLGELGAKVHIVDLQEPKVPCESFVPCDLSDPAQIRTAAQALGKIGPIHFLFPCAGLAPHIKGPLYCMQVNYIGTRYFVEQVLPFMADGGGIAVISSSAGMAWQQNLAQNLEMLAISDPEAALAWVQADPDKRLRDGYTTSKEMLAVWVQHAAVELGNTRRIRINATAPCPTKTAFFGPSGDVYGDLFDKWPFPSLGRMATAEEQAWPLILLNSPLNAVVTGSFLYTDQGFCSGIMTGALDGSLMQPQAHEDA